METVQAELPPNTDACRPAAECLECRPPSRNDLGIGNGWLAGLISEYHFENSAEPYAPRRCPRSSGNPIHASSHSPCAERYRADRRRTRHVGVLHTYAMKQNPGARLTMMRSDTETPYSGMLPSDIAGHCVFDEVHVDLCRLAEPAGARHCRDEVVGIACGSRKVLCRKRPPMADDALLINIGSMPRPAGVAGPGEQNLPVKPIHRFNERWLALLADTQ